MTLALGQICELQKQYGKTSANLQTLVDGFLWVLADYPMADILRGLSQYVKRHPDIPAPADIVNLIDPAKQEWKPDWAAYFALKKRIQQDGYYAYGSEREFLRRCDDYAINRALGSADAASDDERTDREIATREKTFAIVGPEA